MAKSFATLTIRNVPMRVIRGLKALARRRHKSMEQEARDLLQEYVDERSSVIKQIAASWQRQARRPSARELDAWISARRE